MRVLLVTDWLREPGGVEAYVGWLRAGLARAGDEVRLLTSSVGSAGDGTADFVAWGTERVVAQAALQIVNPFAIARVREALGSFRPDVALVNAFAFQLSPAVLTALRAVPTVLSVPDYKVVCPLGTKLLPDGALCTRRAGLVCWQTGCLGLAHWLRDRPRYALIRAAVRGVDRVVSCSRWVQRELECEGIVSDHVGLPVPPPGASFRRAPARDPLLMYCGRLSGEKGVPLLLGAFARLHAEIPAARLRVVGQGAQRPLLARRVRELGLVDAVTFTGWLPPAGVEQQLAEAWALVAPSRWAEPFGFAALEAIVRGVPVVASQAGGLGETVEDGVSGLLFPNSDEAALLDRLRAIACGGAFPAHVVPDDVVQRVANTHDLARHIGSLREIFAEAVAARRA